MSDYISRDKVAQAFEDADVDVCEDYGEYYGCEWGFSRDAVRKIVAELPTADVVEVTFCKDCRYYQDAKVNEKGFLICPASGMEITETDYCSYGSRMDKEDEHETD